MMNFIDLEKKILKFWQKNEIPQKIILAKKDKPLFTYYDAPHVTNRLPNLDHVLFWGLSDVISRYKTMKGFAVEQQTIWDSHRLFIEAEIRKKLSLENPVQIKKYGINRFNEECQTLSGRYQQDWKNLMEKIGFWFKTDNALFTYQNNYIENVWKIIKQIAREGFLYYDNKIVPYCSQCQTSLDFHELENHYKTIKETGIYFILPILKTNQSNIASNIAALKRHWGKIDQTIETYFLVWAINPWTLPANTALAINPKIPYYQIKIEIKPKKEIYIILAKNKIDIIKEKYEIIKEFKGETLIGLSYQPLFDDNAKIKNLENENNGWKVYPANFGESDQDTGIIHLAPAFGKNDMKMAKEYNLPIIININEQGKFKEENKSWHNKSINELNQLVIKALEEKNLIYKKESYQHQSPFCWVCDQKLLYYVKSNWFIKTSKIKNILIENNQTINWISSQTKITEFNQWVDTLEDWNFSKEFYWGIPLPIWECQNCSYSQIIENEKEIIEKQTDKMIHNQYFILRSGESHFQKNFRNFTCSDWPEIIFCPLTDKGVKDIQLLASNIKKNNTKIDLIFSSDFLRTKETAEIIAKELNIKVNFSSALREINYGTQNQTLAELHDDQAFYNLDLFYQKSAQHENWNHGFKRTMELLDKIEEKYKDKTILIISHGDILLILEARLKGLSNQEILEIIYQKKESKFQYLKPGELRKITFKHLPFNLRGEIDLHLPYIDKIKLSCPKCHHLMKRADNIINPWLDCGAFPFMTRSHPSHDKKILNNKTFSSIDLVYEGTEETKNWYLALLLLSSLLGTKQLYKNIILTNHFFNLKEKERENLDQEQLNNQKTVSSSPLALNTTVAAEMLKEFGVDTIRFCLYTNYSPEKRLKVENFQKTSICLDLFWKNFQAFLKYLDEHFVAKENFKPNQLLDLWIISKINSLNDQVTKHLERYEVIKAAQLIENFINHSLKKYTDYSQLILSQVETSEKKEEILQVIYYLFLNLAKISASFIPFMAEEIYQELKKYDIEVQVESIHLSDYPQIKQNFINKELEQKMEEVEKIIGEVLAERKKKKIKITQPLLVLEINNQELLAEPCFISILKKEINVEKISLGKDLKLHYKIHFQSPEKENSDSEGGKILPKKRLKKNKKQVKK